MLVWLREKNRTGGERRAARILPGAGGGLAPVRLDHAAASGCPPEPSVVAAVAGAE